MGNPNACANCAKAALMGDCAHIVAFAMVAHTGRERFTAPFAAGVHTESNGVIALNVLGAHMEESKVNAQPALAVFMGRCAGGVCSAMAASMVD
eukprot:5023791-Amphidinium_carterae.1